MPLPHIDLDLALGKGPVKHDDRTLPMARYTTAAPPPPPTADWSGKVRGWSMFANDEFGDCTFATAGHELLAWSTYAGRTPIRLSDDEVLAAYSALTGFRPDDPDTDRGAVELDVLNYWRRVGIGGHKITAYASVDFRNVDQLKLAISLFGGVYVGLALPLAARSQFKNGQLWRPGFGPSARKGSWGLHAVPILGYDSRGCVCPTWGRLQWMTWGFTARYMDECYAIVSPTFFDDGGHTPQGLDANALMGDLRRVTGG
jgi:hypothetical protein